LPAPPGPPGTSLILSGPLAAAHVPLLCDRLADLLAARADPAATAPVPLDVSRIVVTLEAVDVLTRLQLTARRLGGSIALHGAAPQLVELVEICGLAGVLLRPRRADRDPPAAVPDPPAAVPDPPAALPP
jgi:ABC-type transporter Mla MlaB component